jgi:hypothetical protein
MQEQSSTKRNLLKFSLIPKPGRKNVRHVLRDLINLDEVWDQVAPYLLDGVKTGHKVFDLSEIVRILKSHDHEKRLKPFELNDYQIGQQFNAVLREAYTLDKSWKAVAYGKRIGPMTPPAESATEQPPATPAE